MLTKMREQKGMAAVEFGLLLPIFAMLLFAVVEFGSALNTHQILSAAAREAGRFGARAADPRPSSGQVEQKAKDYLAFSGLDAAKSNVGVSGAGGSSGDQLSVKVTYPTTFPFLSTFLAEQTSIPGTLDLSAEVVLELD